jgi:hypothetical protein
MGSIVAWLRTSLRQCHAKEFDFKPQYTLVYLRNSVLRRRKKRIQQIPCAGKSFRGRLAEQARRGDRSVLAARVPAESGP